MLKLKNDKRERLQKMLEETKGNTLDIYYVIYDEYLKNNADGNKFLEMICEIPNKLGENDTQSEKVSPSIEKEIQNEYTEYLEQTVALLIKANHTKERFYEHLWNMVFASPTVPKEAERCAVLLQILCEKIADIPYYQVIDTVNMNDEEFIQRFTELTPLIMEAFQLMRREFSQRTEETSQIYRLLKDLSKEDACVFLTACFNVLEEKAYYIGKAAAELGETSK